MRGEGACRKWISAAFLALGAGRNLWEAALDLVYPPACGACDALLVDGQDPVSGVFCSDCSNTLEPVGADCCPSCAAPRMEPFVEFFESTDSSGDPGPPRMQGMEPTSSCHDCRRLQPAFDRTFSPWLYGGALLEALYRLKYEGRVHLARPMGRLLFFGLPRPLEVDVVVPVPSHPMRVRQRGFDHVHCMAHEVSLGLGPPALAALRRRRNTPPQARLNLRGRLKNLEGSIDCARGTRRHLHGRRVLLVDDVMTSGATAHTCATALLAAGARAVSVAVLARAP